MNFVNCGYSVTLCIAVVLAMVNGQPTTDDNTESDVTAQLRTVLGLLANAIGRIANLEMQLSALSARIKSRRGKLRSAP